MSCAQSLASTPVGCQMNVRLVHERMVLQLVDRTVGINACASRADFFEYTSFKLKQKRGNICANICLVVGSFQQLRVRMRCLFHILYRQSTIRARDIDKLKRPPKRQVVFRFKFSLSFWFKNAAIAVILQSRPPFQIVLTNQSLSHSFHQTIDIDH